MFKPKHTVKEKTGLELAIERLHSDMQAEDPDTDKYAKMADNLTKLYKLREFDKNDEQYRPSADTLTIVLGNLSAVLIIVAYEQKHVITTKATSFLQKLR